MYREVEIIAEVKTRSPFGHASDKSWDELFEVANKIGDIISIHTDLRWGGSFELLEKARALTDKPILAKGIHKNDTDVERAIALGANWVLVVGRIPAVHAEKCLIEPLTLEELKRIPENFRAVWNARDLKDGSLKTETFAEARKVFGGWLCQASHLQTVADIKEGADAVLVGTNLLGFVASLQFPGASKQMV
jgi:indole-3-glycerol phosphate synthase